MAGQVRSRAFISYSRDDIESLKLLLPHLSPELRNNQIWWDGLIKAGQEWRNEIEQALASAKVAFFMVSASFLASEFSFTVELPQLLDAAKTDGVKILWSLVRYCRWQETPLFRYQAVPYQQTHTMKAWNALDDAQRDDLLRQVAQEIAASLRPAPTSPVSAAGVTTVSGEENAASPQASHLEEAAPSPVPATLPAPPAVVHASAPRLLAGVEDLKTIDEIGAFFILRRRWHDAKLTYAKLLDCAAPREEQLWMARGYEKLGRIYLQEKMDKRAHECLQLAQLFYRWTGKVENAEEMRRLL